VSQPLDKAERDLDRARHILAGSGQDYQPEEWALLASLIVEADLAFQEARRDDPALEWPLLEAAVQDLRDATSGFTKPAFLRASRAARRRNPMLFK
jgi:hypothetical protein